MDDAEEAPDVVAELTMLRARAELLEVALQQARDTASRNIVQSQLQLEAVKSGMVDLDGLMLLDIGDIPRDEKGGLKDAAGVITKLRRQKPWLFNGASSSAHAAAPASAPPKVKRATDMTLAEWREARSDLLRHR